MALGCLIVCCCLVGQPAARQSIVQPTQPDNETRPLVPVEERKARLRPSGLIAEALTPPAKNPLLGRRMTLADVLARTPARDRQLAVVQSYWTLAATVGEYHWARQEQEVLSTLLAGLRTPRSREAAAESTALAAELALANAHLRETELHVAAAQSELVERAALGPSDPLPLPADLPHVGGYDTKFAAAFAGRIPPPRMQLLDRTLPLRHKAIAVRADAIQASLDALTAAQDAHEHNDLDAEAVAARIDQLSRQRRAYLDAVRQYNQEIAEYALAVGPPGSTPAAIRAMLIIPPSDAPAGRQARRRPAAAQEHIAQFQDAPAADHDNYAPLLKLDRPARTQRLTKLLHWDRGADNGDAPELTLRECLSRVSPNDRRRAIEAYWLTREQAARCQVLSDRNDQLEVLYPQVLAAAARPGGAEAMLDLRSRQKGAEADLLDARALLLARRLDLATITGRAGNIKDWPHTTTPPHGGRYEMRLDSQPQSVAQSMVIQNLAVSLPGQHAALEDRADAIVRLDTERGQAADSFDSARRINPWRALAWIDRQADESSGFLAALTRYNLSIAQYAMTVLSPSDPDLAAALVVQAR